MIDTNDGGGGKSLIELLCNRSFVLLWLGQMLGVLADWALRALLLIWVFHLTGSGVAVSLVGVAAIAPMLIVGPVAGVFVDRWHRAYTMSGAMLVRGGLVMLLTLVHGRSGLIAILTVTLLFNCASQILGPAIAAATPMVIRQAELGQANSLLSLVNGVGAVAGPAVGSLLLLRLGPANAFMLVAAVYALAASLLAGVRAGKPARGISRSGTQTDMVAGIRYVAGSPLLIFLTAVAFVALLGLGSLSVLDVVFVVRALHLRPELAGVLLTSNGIGMVVGGLGIFALSSRRWADYRWLLGVSLAGNGLSLATYAVAPTLAVVATTLGLSGACFIVSLVSFTTLIQLESENAYLGRVMSFTYIPMGAAIVLSMSCGGVLADLLGIRQVIAGEAVLVICASILSLMTVPRKIARREFETGRVVQ